MEEALILLADLLVMTCLCWVVWRGDRARTKSSRRSLGLFAYKDEDQS
jgi:hypothetical protein